MVLLKNRIVQHTLFWVIYTFLWVLTDVFRGRPFDESVYRYLGCVFEIPFYYFHMYYLWPKLVGMRKYILYVLSMAAVLLTSAYAVRVWEYFVMFPLLFGFDAPAIHFKMISVIGLARSILQWFGPPTVIKLFRDWYEDRIKLERAKKEQKISELNYLKAQMNPHFLFNTLNNLYALSIKGSKKTPDALLQLSELLSYTLYEGSNDRVSLEKEIAHLNDYVELEKLRFGDRLKFDLEIGGDLKDVNIPPLILIPIVENAFKHCSLNERGKVDIKVSIAATNESLEIATDNPVAKKKVDTSGRNGIGSMNLTKRLELLFPDHHVYTMEESDGRFRVKLNIQLTEEWLNKSA